MKFRSRNLSQSFYELPIFLRWPWAVKATRTLLRGSSANHKRRISSKQKDREYQTFSEKQNRKSNFLTDRHRPNPSPQKILKNLNWNRIQIWYRKSLKRVSSQKCETWSTTKLRIRQCRRRRKETALPKCRQRLLKSNRFKFLSKIQIHNLSLKYKLLLHNE